MNPYYLIDFSGAIRGQGFWQADAAAGQAVLVDCRDISGCQYFCSDEARAEIVRRLEQVQTEALHFIDSGDYHYVSLFFLERIRQPFTLLLLDHHSDCMESAFGGGLLTCGSWVLQALQTLPQLKRVVMIGPADEDGTGQWLRRQERVIWVTEEEFPKESVFLMQQLKEYPVYLSLDKDVLSAKEAVTDWSQGSMQLTDIAAFLQEVKPTLLGADICGEQRCDREGFSAEHPGATEINSRINERIVICQKDWTFFI